jgi:23S rRNA G2069 N7-methylase RlmK/C1962 C5-methylase RlmI
VNLKDYLDTGLFLDHRETRKMVASISKGKRLLNLFAYTCSFSVQAASSGACFTKSVDMSNTYTEWGKDNFLLNGLSLKNNEIVRADCLKFLDYEMGEYDIIVIDPPTISRSKKMEQLFDIQIDYVALITKSLKLLLPGGVIFFSTNSRKFKFEDSLFAGCSIREITDKTLPLDFHNKKIHRCWKIMS